jgi:hypothetical protein
MNFSVLKKCVADTKEKLILEIEEGLAGSLGLEAEVVFAEVNLSVVDSSPSCSKKLF